MRRSCQALATLSECNQTIVRAKDEQQFMQDVCRIVVEHGGYRMAWIGLKEDDPERTVRPVARAGRDDGYLERVRVTWADTERGVGPTGRAIRTGQTCAARFIATDPSFEPWRADALEQGFGSSLALPIRDNSAIIGALSVYAIDPDAFDDDSLPLIEELATDIGLGLATLRSRVARRRAQARVEHLNSVLRGLRGVGRLITQERDVSVLIQKACEILVESRGFYTALIVLCEGGETKQVGAAGDDPAFRLLPAIIDREGLPECLRQVMASRDVAAKSTPFESCPGCPANAACMGERDSLAIRIEHDGVLYGALLVSAETGTATDEEEIGLLREMARDVAFALQGIEAENRQRKIEEQLMLSQRLEAVGRLAGGVAHDFNNLLSVVISYADFAFEELHENDPVREDIEEIQKAGKRAAALTKQLLAFSRKQVLEPEVLSINKVVGGIESMLRRLLGEDIDIAVHLADELGSAMADPGQIEQVIMNLAVNARDAMPQGGKLTIETENTELGADYAVQHVAVTPVPFLSCHADRSQPSKTWI